MKKTPAWKELRYSTLEEAYECLPANIEDGNEVLTLLEKGPFYNEPFIKEFKKKFWKYLDKLSDLNLDICEEYEQSEENLYKRLKMKYEGK